MRFENLLNLIDANHQRIAELKSEKKQTLEKLKYTFQLEWNYHSNKIEGGPLTIEDTKKVMAGVLFESTIDKKYIEEMRGHNELVEEVFNTPPKQLELKPKRIKEMHKKIMHENNSARMNEVGQWKSQDNYVINYRKEKFKFLSVDFVDDEIKHICKELAFDLESEIVHPVELAAKFFLDFIEIHPFYDGNGRVGRALSNLILINYGFPPCIIKSNEKENYFQLLADIQSYGSNEELFFCFFAEKVLNAQEEILKAFDGEVFVAVDDNFTNRLELLNEKLHNLTKADKETIDKPIVNKLLDGWLLSLSKQLFNTVKLFEQFFEEPSHFVTLSHEGTEKESRVADYLQLIKWLQNEIQSANELRKSARVTIDFFRNTQLKKVPKASSQLMCVISVELFPTHYVIATNFNENNFTFDNRIYEKAPTKEEVSTIINTCKLNVLEYIEKQYTELNAHPKTSN
ncbi:Fic family protein [Acidiluteibacter ferrifornacis]|uniref:Fido domain-containing protein n=1 Tax=Acidiluteibacter ferrifornacis TaxID=2692424 RepID=A0A6N9NQG8_9FLAO|nr:Fic family protein [Acidiluteibacter ferrifornacis]NBG67327.1 hypothetical protein [Acidiluteibacter ferrifornacis]